MQAAADTDSSETLTERQQAVLDAA
ncbi:MAG: TetR/AcrR family transcriptional regulator, partial [Mesorhizobium sp.]